MTVRPTVPRVLLALINAFSTGCFSMNCTASSPTRLMSSRKPPVRNTFTGVEFRMYAMEMELVITVSR